jgi:hypothetical protein
MDGLPIYDPTEAPNIDSWFPANDASAALVASLEACKNMTRLIDGLERTAPLDDARGLTLLATPLVSFADNVCSLNNVLSREDKSHWPAKDRDILKESLRKMNRARNGPLRLIRKKRSAHNDPEPCGVPRPSPDIFLPVMWQGLCSIILLLNHERVFWWTRSSPNAPFEKITIFGEVATTFQVDGSKNPVGIEGSASDIVPLRPSTNRSLKSPG